ncbi:hypothetical protein JT359_00340 [Candidatus Poribacteria bacterium]|nr:hypothetical protein [Candidatus Poribacteria bacterium]
MSDNKTVTTLQDALRGDYYKTAIHDVKMSEELESDLNDMFHNLHGHELAESVVLRIHLYATQNSNWSIEDDYHEIGGKDLDDITNVIRDRLTGLISSFITDEHREFIVRSHAGNISTVGAVSDLIRTDAVFNRLADDDALGMQKLSDLLVHRLSYLKPGTARWPEKKYGALWNEAREEYKQSINNLPFTSTVEQTALLAKHAESISNILDNKNSITIKDFHLLTNTLTTTIASLQKMTAVQETESIPVSTPQLVAVLERLTLALDVPEQLALIGDSEAFISVLEQLSSTLKNSTQKALTVDSDEDIQDVEVVSKDGDGTA